MAIEKVGGNVFVNTVTAGNQTASRVSLLGSDSFLVTWTDQSTRKGQVITADGPAGPEFTIFNSASIGAYAQITLADGRVAVLDETNHIGRIVGLDGTPSGDQFALIPNSTSYEAATALAGGGFVLATSANGYVDIASQAFDSSGAKVGAQITFSSGTFNEFVAKDVVSLSNGGYALLYKKSSGGLAVRTFDASGSQTSTADVSTLTTDIRWYNDIDSVRLPDGRLFVAWSQQNPQTQTRDIFGRFLSEAGVPLDSPFLVNTSTARDQYSPQLTLTSNGNIGVAWYTGDYGVSWDDGAPASLQSQILNSTGQKIGAETTVSSTQTSARLLVAAPTADGGIVYTWRAYDSSGEGARLRHINADGTVDGSEILVNTAQAGHQYAASVAVTSTGHVLALIDDASGLDGDQGGVLVQRLSLNGAVWSNVATDGDDIIDLGPGDDTFDALAGNDTITGGTGADTLNGSAGNDVFIVRSGDLATGDTIDGGADTDTVRVEGGGTVDLTPLSLTSVEAITLTGAAGTNVTVTAAQAALISAATGTTDIVTISGNFNTDTALVKQLLNAGVDQVKWTSSVYGSATAVVDPSDATQFIVTYNDNDLTRAFDYLRTTYDASGNRVAQTQLFDTGLSNGVLQQQEYDPATGGLISNVYIDSLDTRTFQSITTDFSNGIRTHTRTINDNNTAAATDDTIVDQDYDAAGVITLELTTDASPGGAGKPWVSVAREYVGGVTQIFRTTYDNANQQVLGTAGTQEIEGGSGNDVLIGGAGADVFVFAPGFGNDTVNDYLDGTDKFDFTAFNVDTRAELDAIASITTAGTATLISLNAGGSVKILNLAPAALGDSDFVLI